jgi:hypothetical protein
VNGDRFATWVVDHPIRWGLVSGLAGFGIGVAFSGLLVIGLVLGLSLVLFNWWVWRPDGPACRGRALLLRRFPRP